MAIVCESKWSNYKEPPRSLFLYQTSFWYMVFHSFPPQPFLTWTITFRAPALVEKVASVRPFGAFVRIGKGQRQMPDWERVLCLLCVANGDYERVGFSAFDVVLWANYLGQHVFTMRPRILLSIYAPTEELWEIRKATHFLVNINNLSTVWHQNAWNIAARKRF